MGNPPDSHRIALEIVKGTGVICGMLIFTMFFNPLMLFLPLPVMFYRARLGRRLGKIVLFMGILVVGLMTGSLGLEFIKWLFWSLLILGYFLQDFLERGLSLEKTLVFSGTLVMLILFAALLAKSISGSTTVTGFLEKSLEQTFGLLMQAANVASGEVASQVSAFIKMIGTPADYFMAAKTTGLAPDKEAMQRAAFVLVRIAPSSMATFFLITALVCLRTAGPVYRRKGLTPPELGDFTVWRSPENLMWVTIACGVMMVLPVGLARFIGVNGILVLLMVYFFQGMAITAFFLKRVKVSIMAQWVIYVLIFFTFLQFIVLALGFFDLWLDVRKLKQMEET